MLTVDAAFDRIGSALRQMGYTFKKEERARDGSGDRLAMYDSPNMSVRLRWAGKARLMALEVEVDGAWTEFARRNAGPDGIEDTAAEALVHAIRNEVNETSTDGG
jgi:hypothetical protein